jgi:hypothetical protein
MLTRAATVLLAGMVSACAPGQPPETTGIILTMLCLVNCPLTLMVADEGANTDALAQEYPYLNPENVRTRYGDQQ